jgi:hypothetical protein
MESVKLTVRPIEGRQVRKEDGTLLPVKGCVVPNNGYYRRRIKEGDLIVDESVVSASSAAKTSKATAKPAKGDK